VISSALTNGLLTAPVIAFLVAMAATFLRCEIRLPDSLYPVLSSFLLLAIGIKGGKALSATSPYDMWKLVRVERLVPTDPLFVGLFTGALTLFLLELGVVAAERMRDVKKPEYGLFFSELQFHSSTGSSAH